MHKVFFSIAAIFIVIMIFFISNIDFTDLRSKQNIGPILSSVSNLLLSIAMIIFGYNAKKKATKNS